MTITLYTITDDPRKVGKTLGAGTAVTGELVLPTEMETPSIRLSTSEVGTNNYLYIPAFGRYYFIVNKSFDNGGAIILHCRVDVLEAFKTGILALTCNIIRQEQAGMSKIIDNQITFTPQKTLETIMCDVTPFNIRQTGAQYNYVLCIAGGEQGE